MIVIEMSSVMGQNIKYKFGRAKANIIVELLLYSKIGGIFTPEFVWRTTVGEGHNGKSELFGNL